MDVLTLPENEFFRKQTGGKNDNQHIDFNYFVLMVSEVRIQIHYKPLSVECLN